MNDLVLKNLEEIKNIGCIGIKTSFEDEGAQFNDLVRLRNFSLKKNLLLIIKIGGCEANSDILMAENLCCDGLVAPMIESEYSILKYTKSIENYKLNNKLIGINLETKNGNDIKFNNNILEKINCVTIGRVDLVGSLGLTRKEINSDEVYNIIFNTFSKIRNINKNIKLYLGGSIDENSFNFIKKLYDNNLIDYVETRFIIYEIKTFIINYKECIKKANEFEYNWLNYLNNIKKDIIENNDKRINTIKNRI